MSQALPISVVIPTRHRAEALQRTLLSLAEQSHVCAELLLVDGSEDQRSKAVLEEFAQQCPACQVRYLRADSLGAAVQRNQGISAATQDVIGFMDDDILLEPNCVARLWSALQSSPEVGGVNAMITNQRYERPGRASRLMFRLMGGPADTWAGRVLGPAVNLLPEDREDLPEQVPVDWLNTTCTLYRRQALPQPVFSSHFTGYSLMEDVTLSLTVGKKWKLLNARTARIYHDSQPGSHKNNPAEVACMDLVNRYYVMTHVLDRRGLIDHGRLLLWELFQVLAVSRQVPLGRLVSHLFGKCRAAVKIVFGR
jgi:glycosyltransferase involved in cell wall biosynthesis